MLLETRDKLKELLKRYVDENNISTYKARKEKLYIGDIYYNTIYLLIKNPNYSVRNTTIIKLLDFFEVPYDIEFFKQNDIVKLYEHEKEI